ncbi:RNA 2',3'-cyclic phosphodiesterase [Tessaracoccus sp. Y36]|uniref:RNA 2',3'-cyclic phosphodiesterase n=1 Tax=Tessaracoccus sp. MC1756 TaxID=2760311 RepID=UPI001601795F|nr:RNA 2',3'-cyclic phosphodiesterase [Tessaracoccus sp. MC1756]MBB1509347.1 RNA 2',3'-cyclic phosphodiesterase [Tessaracoccus sp. MC1756]
MSKRMFTAVLPPPEVIQELDSYVAPRREADRDLRWTRPEGWHLTTSFMGHVGVGRDEYLEDHLAEVAAGTQPFEVRIAGGIAFPNPVRARIIGLGVPVGHEPLASLSAHCRTAASRAGIDVDGSRFVGHLTLARNSRGVQATRWLTVLDSFPGWSWTADELVLIESRSTGYGFGYEVAARFALGRPVADPYA